MKICFLIDAPWDKWGGGQEHVTRVAKVLVDKYGHTVDIIHPQKINPKFNFLNFTDRLWFTFWVIKFLLNSDYDLYHSHTFSTSSFLPIVKLRGKKTAITLHGTGDNLIGGGLLNLLKLPKIWSWLVLEVWPFDLKFTAGKYKNFKFVGNGVDVEEFDRFRAKPKMTKSKFTIFWLGRRYDPIKGVKYLEEAVRGLDINLDIQTAIFGQEKIKHFKSADMYVLPSLSEGLPIVMLEAMAAKLPIVATDVGDCKKIIEEAKCGVVVAPGDSKVLRQAILKVKDSNLSYGENGYQFVKKNFTWGKVATIYNSSYCHLNS